MKKLSCFGKNIKQTEPRDEDYEQDNSSSINETTVHDENTSSHDATHNSSSPISDRDDNSSSHYATHNSSSRNSNEDGNSSSRNATHNSSNSETNVNVAEQMPPDSVPKDAIDHARDNAILFTYRELVVATNFFSPKSCIGEGLYTGQLAPTNQMVAVKELNPDSNLEEFIPEVITLTRIRHPHLIDFIGFCADEGHRMLVYKAFPLQSLQFHLQESTLDWKTRLRIAYGVAKALDYIHDHAVPYPVICMDLKSDSILLDENFDPVIAAFGLAKFELDEDRKHGSNRVKSSLAYCMPEYSQTGDPTFKTDTYSFGVLMLELITGKVAFDDTSGQTLLQWVRDTLVGNWDPLRIVDRRLDGQYKETVLRRATKMALMCVERIEWRSKMVQVVSTLLTHITLEEIGAEGDGGLMSRANVGSSSTSNPEFDLGDAED